MLVTVDKIKKLRPCQDRFDNFKRHHPQFRGKMADFLKLDGISHSDKCWVYFRLVSRETAVAVAADIAESVLHLYEEQYPDDSRPRDAIAAARRGDKDAATYAARADAAAYAAHADAARITKADADTEKRQYRIMLRRLREEESNKG